MSVIKCKMCGGNVEFDQGATVGVCESCGTKQTLPKLDDDKIANLFDRASHFRRHNEFDKADAIYEMILAEDKTDAEAYWSLVLCRYGIEYVEDPVTHRRVPTVNRTQNTSIYNDENYKAAIQNADLSQRVIYEEEAEAIDKIQKEILTISRKEEPFDVFICYKETDNSGKRTEDSVLANDLYHQLTQEGLKVFFARISLEDKLGSAYEPYIFAALNSAKVMVVLGTRPEHFNAAWVKNEWSRFLTMTKSSNGKKVLIPAYRDMDPYDLPEEFAHLQAQDMNKLGFMQDLIRGIKKIMETHTSNAPTNSEIVASNNGSIEQLIKRVFMFLEDHEWDKADEYCERILDHDPENGRAWLGKLMVHYHASRMSSLSNCDEAFIDHKYFKKIERYSDKELVSELMGYYATVKDRLQAIQDEKDSAHYEEGIERLKEAEAALSKCDYDTAKYALHDAQSSFSYANGYKDSEDKLKLCDEMGGIIQEEILKREEMAKEVGIALCNWIAGGRYVYEAMKEEANKKISYYNSIHDHYDSTMAQIEKKKLEIISLKQNQNKLFDEIDSLGFFAKKQREPLYNAINSLQDRIKQVNEEISQLNSSIGGFASKDDVENNTKREELIINSLDQKLMVEENIKYSFDEAFSLYRSDSILANTVKYLYPETGIFDAKEGDEVIFGNYPQQKDGRIEPITWIVVAKSGGKLLLLSKDILDWRQISDSTTGVMVCWENCLLRKWLNEFFIRDAFDLGEQGRIMSVSVQNTCYSASPYRNTIDRVFLLSSDEVKAYNKFLQKSFVTEYAKKQGAGILESDWWLRSPAGLANNFLTSSTGEVITKKKGVRPAMWVDMEIDISNHFSSI